MIYFKNFTAIWRKPAMVLCGMFAPQTDLSWIPTINYQTIAAPLEAPDGERVTFTFSSTPVAVVCNGTIWRENSGYTRDGNTITWQDGFVPSAGMDIWGLV
jgi:hypothetical protein